MTMLTCKGASHLISERQERPLGLRERWALRTHLWICANCRRFERQIELLRRALREMGRQSQTDQAGELPADVKARIEKALAERDRRAD